MAAILEVKDLQVYYGVIQALKGISFEVNQGEIIALIGANGAGKTTTLQTITGMIPSKGGSIIYDGQDITRMPGYNMSIMILVYVVLGGLGNIRGSIIAAVILTALPELLRGLNDYRMLIYAIVLIVMMIFNSSPKVLEKRAVLKEKFRNKKNTAKEAA